MGRAQIDCAGAGAGTGTAFAIQPLRLRMPISRMLGADFCLICLRRGRSAFHCHMLVHVLIAYSSHAGHMLVHVLIAYSSHAGHNTAGRPSNSRIRTSDSGAHSSPTVTIRAGWACYAWRNRRVQWSRWCRYDSTSGCCGCCCWWYFIGANVFSGHFRTRWTKCPTFGSRNSPTSYRIILGTV